MLDTLFGDMPMGLRIIVVFALVLILLAGCMWVLRRYGAGRVGSTATRGRQPRLAVVDSAAVDARRRLVIVRRDNVEHLLMIGGPSDVVVEQNIVRGMPVARDRGVAAAPMDNGGWTQPQPEQAPRPPLEAIGSRPSRVTVMEDSTVRSMESDTAPRPGNGLGGLADELAARAGPPHDLDSAALRMRPITEPMTLAPVRSDTPRFEPMREEPLQTEPARPAARAESRPVRVEPLRAEPLRTEPRGEAPRDMPRAEPPRESARVEPLRAEANREPARPAAVAPTASGPVLTAGADQNLAEMAQLLEVALRRPGSEARPQSGVTTPTPLRATTGGAEAAAARARRPVEPSDKAPRGEGKPKSLYDSIEQEMASLLTRPASKS